MNILLLAMEFPPAMRGGLANYSYNIAKHLGKDNNVTVTALPDYPATRGYASSLKFIYGVLKKIDRPEKREKWMLCVK